jgi:catechol 2,3-dioxygenase-like lactoylglutathione lyase family enzyme
MDKVSVRYIVVDVDAAIPFYTELLGFQVDMHPAPGFASLSKGNLQLLLNQPGVGGADRRCPTARCLPPAAGIESKSRLGLISHRREVAACRMPVPQRDRDRERRKANSGR